MLHESGADGLSAGPGLRATAVNVDSVYVRGEHESGAVDFFWGVDAELGDCWGWVESCCEI